ncbi:MAG: PQQ-binding-like beta-propeller repeat protein, partial [Rhodospirillaceae bacterium]|nr:PQQ-binding-like beta-propeller repeat protein [Rhodospirillaceae bacterium]
LRMVWTRPLQAGIQEGTPVVYEGVMYFPSPGDVIQAIAADTGETRWTYEQRAGTMSLVATGGGLVFGGDTNGYFRAFDQASGEVLWEVNIGSEVTGYPVAYAVDGKQYVAVSTGTSSLTGRLTDLTPELNPGTANNLFVFALPD